MALTKRVGLGVVISVDIAGGTSFAALGSIVNGVDGPPAKGNVYDTSLISDKYITKGVAQVDPGEATFTIAYDPLDTGTTTVLTGLLADGNIANWQIAYPVIGAETQQKDTFLGALSGFKRTVDKNKMIVAEISIAVSGKPGYTGD